MVNIVPARSNQPFRRQIRFPRQGFVRLSVSTCHLFVMRHTASHLTKPDSCQRRVRSLGPLYAKCRQYHVWKRRCLGIQRLSSLAGYFNLPTRLPLFCLASKLDSLFLVVVVLVCFSLFFVVSSIRLSIPPSLLPCPLSPSMSPLRPPLVDKRLRTMVHLL